MNKFVSAWYVLYTKPRHERKVAQKLEENGVNYYCPIVKMKRQWHDRQKIVNMPLFPSYIFVHVSAQTHFSRILNFSGSVSFVGFGDEKARVKDNVINDLMMVVNNIEDVEVIPDFISPGERLRITGGPLSGRECEVVEFQRKQKIIVRLDLLNRSVLAMVSGDLLGPLGL